MQSDQKHKTGIIKQLGQLAPQWGKLDVNKFEIRRMSGITNQTFKVSHPDIGYSLIYRKFSDAEDNPFLDRQKQDFIYKYLSDHKIGPKIIGMSKDIRLQQFIQSKVLKTKQMLTGPIIEKVAHSLRQFHSIHPKNNIPTKSLHHQAFFDEKSLILYKCYQKMEKPIFTQEQQQILKILARWINKQEIQELRKFTQSLQNKQLVFSHNDLLAGNVLIRESDKRTVFIDYEYSSYNYRAYDIANYFNEAVYDYEVQQLPYFRVINLSQQQENMKDHFIKCYAMAQCEDYEKYMEKVKNNEKLNQSQQKIYKQIKQSLVLGVMLSHYMWGVWAVIVSKNPQIQFDYIAFALQRFTKYQKSKQIYLASLNK